jgi:tetratricopeptide (TPR) repeat protein
MVAGLMVLLVLVVIGRLWPLSITPQLGRSLVQTPATSTPTMGLLQAGIVLTDTSPPPTTTQVPSSSIVSPPTRVPIIAAPGETLLVVAQFSNYAGEASFNVAGRIQEALQTRISAAQLGETRVAVWPDAVAENGSAESVLSDTGATMMIWGEYDSGRVRVSFTRPAGLTTGWQRLLNSPSELSTTINLDVPREVQALALLTVGQLYRDAGEVDKAKAAFVQALAEQPREADTVATLSFYLGYLYAASRPPELDKAIDAYGQTIALRPEWLNARYNRGRAYFDRYWQNGKTEELDAAIADVDVVLAERPHTVDALINRGIAFYTRNQPGDVARAMADFDAALAQDSRSLKGYYNRGVARIRAGNSPGWESDLARALELQPDYMDAIYALCWGYALDNLPDKGLSYCETATAADTSGYSRDARGLVYAELGRLEEAALDFEMYVAWLRMQPASWYEIYHGATYVDMIDAMRAGQNPITTELLDSLR